MWNFITQVKNTCIAIYACKKTFVKKSDLRLHLLFPDLQIECVVLCGAVRLLESGCWAGKPYDHNNTTDEVPPKGLRHTASKRKYLAILQASRCLGYNPIPSVTTLLNSDILQSDGAVQRCVEQFG